MRLNATKSLGWVVVALPLFQPSAFAQTELEPIRVEDSAEQDRSEFNQTTSTSISVPEKERDRNATASVGERFQSLPGVNNLSSGSQSGKPVVRGETGVRLPILTQGVSMDYQAEGIRHNPNFEPALTERMEVIRGPSALKYTSQGTQSAINVEPLAIEFAQRDKTKTSGELMGEVNSNHYETMMGAKVKTASHRLGLVGGITRRKGENMITPSGKTAGEVKPGDPAGSRPLVTGTTPYTNYESQAATAGVGYQGDWGTLELHHTYWQSSQNYLGVEATPTGYELIPSAGQILQNEDTQISAEVFADDWVIKPKYAHTRNQRQAMHEVRYEHMSAYRDDEEYLDLVVHRDEYRLAVEHPSFAGWSGEFGVSRFTKDQQLRSGHLTPSANEDGAGVFMVENRKTGAWSWEVGLRYDWQQVKAPLSAENAHFWQETNVYNATNNQRRFDAVTGGLGASYQMTRNWRLAANVGRSFRAPTIFELYASGAHGGVQAYQMGNPDLNAEKGINTQLSAIWESKSLFSSLSIYSNWVEDYIILVNADETRYCNEEGECQATQTLAYPYRLMVNSQTDALIQGVEWLAEYQMTPALSWRATAEIMQGRDTQRHRELPLMPAHNASLAGDYTFGRWGFLHTPHLGLKVRYVAAKDAAGAYEPFSQFDDTPFGTASTQDYWLWNASVGGTLKLDQQPLQWNLTVENLFDTGYRDFLDTYKGYAQGKGRNVRLTANLPF